MDNDVCEVPTVSEEVKKKSVEVKTEVPDENTAEQADKAAKCTEVKTESAGGVETTEVKMEAESAEVKTEDKAIVDCDEAAFDRVQIQNLNKYMSYKQVKTFLNKILDGMPYRKLRHFSDTAYLSFQSPAEAQKAARLIDGQIMKQKTITARLVEPEPLKGHDITKRANNDDNESDRKRAKIITSAKDIVTPLSDMSYEKQLETKQSDCTNLTRNLFRQMGKANIENHYSYSVARNLKRIIPSPAHRAYRNKCEFTVGRNTEGETTVGFVGGRFAADMHYVVPTDDCDNISDHMKRIVKAFENFVKESGLPTFNEFERVGCWKMLTVREFLGDCMVIATVFPFDDAELEKQMKQRLVDFLLDPRNFTNPDRRFRITSVYWQVQKNASDPTVYENIGGTTYIYERLHGMRFRVSPGAFFQTNSRGAEVLFSTIISACGFTQEANGISTNEASNDDHKSEAMEVVPSENCKKEVEKEEAVDSNVSESITEVVESKDSTVFLDICCGVGTIGICVAKSVQNATKTKKFVGKFYGLGVEMIPEAIEDAKKNAAANGIGDDQFRFVAAKAEDVFRDLRYSLPPGADLNKANVVGVLDPPRAGMHERVIFTCREMGKLNRLIFVSCDPKAALKNIVDLCRPRSRKYEGEPFKLETIQPVDMFPQTKHFEWVVTLVR
ncbi:hypothetical protein QR680_005631 [Steinernema hermaphroditum]|uniref:tRNA (uracil(54)-C(5))-methyltransferase n=1 Tax=Steinernema hermaphroditum TaxID=289476 RepID=A0AA39LV85_9BILA|nr:hypothetical protein QR680_005631 [Steinernema hermaphroditum]